MIKYKQDTRKKKVPTQVNINENKPVTTIDTNNTRKSFFAQIAEKKESDSKVNKDSDKDTITAEITCITVGRKNITGKDTDILVYVALETRALIKYTIVGLDQYIMDPTKEIELKNVYSLDKVCHNYATKL